MKKLMCSLAITSALLLSSCGSGISSEDYAAVVSENTELKAELESLSAENQTLSDKNKELLDTQAEQDIEELRDITTTSWVTTSFGDDSILLSDTNQQYLQCIAGKTYTISTEGISELWDDLMSSARTLAYVKDSIPYEIISIRFLDPSGEYILDVTLDMNDPNILHATLCNIMYFDTIIPALQEASSQ